MKQAVFLILMTVVMLIAACSGNPRTTEPINNTTDRAVTLSSGNVTVVPTQSHPGEANYYTLCAHCHGYEGEGQIASIGREMDLPLPPPR